MQNYSNHPFQLYPPNPYLAYLKSISFHRETSPQLNQKQKRSDKMYYKKDLTKRQKQIRLLIQNRYQKSKIKWYRYEDISAIDSVSSQNSSDMEDYQFMKHCYIFNLKDYHLISEEVHQQEKTKQFRKKKIKTRVSRAHRTQNSAQNHGDNRLSNQLISIYREDKFIPKLKQLKQKQKLTFAQAQLKIITDSARISQQRNIHSFREILSLQSKYKGKSQQKNTVSPLLKKFKKFQELKF